MGPEAAQSLDDDEDKELGNTDDENCEDNEIIEEFILRYFFLSRSGAINPLNDSTFHFLYLFSRRKLAINHISHERWAYMLP